MKHALILFLASASLALSQTYQGPTTPDNNQQSEVSLTKINKLLDDAKTGGSPLATSGSVTTTGTSAVRVTGTNVHLEGATVTTSGTLAAGLRAISWLIRSGTLTIPTVTGTVSFTSADPPWGMRVSPDTFDATPYTFTGGTNIFLNVR